MEEHHVDKSKTFVVVLGQFLHLWLKHNQFEVEGTDTCEEKMEGADDVVSPLTLIHGLMCPTEPRASSILSGCKKVGNLKHQETESLCWEIYQCIVTSSGMRKH